MGLREIVEIYREQLKGNANMLPEHEVVLHLHNVMLIILIVFLQVLQNLDFNPSLVMELLLVPHDLDSDVFVVLVIEAFQALSEAT